MSASTISDLLLRLTGQGSKNASASPAPQGGAPATTARNGENGPIAGRPMPANARAGGHRTSDAPPAGQPGRTSAAALVDAARTTGAMATELEMSDEFEPAPLQAVAGFQPGSRHVVESEFEGNREESGPEPSRELENLIRSLPQTVQRREPVPHGGIEAPRTAPLRSGERWTPMAPASLREAGLMEPDIEGLVLKLLHNRGEAAGRAIAQHIRLPFVILEPILTHLKNDQRVYYRGSTAMNDYVYQLTESGRAMAKALSENCTYFGSAPVSLRDYAHSVTEQSLTKIHPTQADVQKAFSDLVLDPLVLRKLGPAINSGRGLFLYGYPGNGKTSIAERITLSFGETVWIPRALYVEGEIVRLYDPGYHVEVPQPETREPLGEGKIDSRWVQIKRPTIIVGGELTLEQLEIIYNRSTGYSEAPFQLKSNCGTLVIDDFGRQKMRTDELLNRWIVPLEKRYDFLNMASGKKIQVPFDQLVVFSTNLEPKDLVDEAFLRRIPYKINVPDPTESQFRQLFQIFAKKMEIRCESTALDHLIQRHYREQQRKFRGCHPRDLLMQIKNLCTYTQQPAEATKENLDFAVSNYFSIM